VKLKKCALSFLRKLVRDEISLMLDSSAFQARGPGPAMEKALSVKSSRVRMSIQVGNWIKSPKLSPQTPPTTRPTQWQSLSALSATD